MERTCVPCPLEIITKEKPISLDGGFAHKILGEYWWHISLDIEFEGPVNTSVGYAVFRSIVKFGEVQTKLHF